MSMPGAEGAAQAGVIRAFVTDGGAHPPGTLAAIDMCQLFTEDSNPDKVAAVGVQLEQAHDFVQQAIREIFNIVGGDDAGRKRITEVIARGIATSLNNERELFKG